MPVRAITLTVFFFLSICRPAWTATYAINNDTAGRMIRYTIQDGDTLYDIARRFDLGIVEIMAANPGIDPWLPEQGTVLLLPTMHVLPPVPRDGIVINLP